MNEWMIKRGRERGREREFGWKESRYRPLPPQFEQAQSADYWLDQMTPPVRTGTSERACRLVRPKKTEAVWQEIKINRTNVHTGDWMKDTPPNTHTHSKTGRFQNHHIYSKQHWPTTHIKSFKTTQYSSVLRLHSASRFSSWNKRAIIWKSLLFLQYMYSHITLYKGSLKCLAILAM